MTTYIVTSTADSAPGSPPAAGALREAIFLANANPGSTIDFSSGLSGPVTLARSLPMITASVTINGGGVTIDANHTGRVFFVEARSWSLSQSARLSTL